MYIFKETEHNTQYTDIFMTEHEAELWYMCTGYKLELKFNRDLKLEKYGKKIGRNSVFHISHNKLSGIDRQCEYFYKE